MTRTGKIRIKAERFDVKVALKYLLSGLLVGVGVLGIVVGAAPVHNLLLEVLLLLLGQANCTAHGALKGLGHLVFIGQRVITVGLVAGQRQALFGGGGFELRVCG